ncbi:acylphosphatase [Streptomyces mirabilis]|uniref:acylphosphatase n=1 Tax=Streptomyces mirabilis TaxID=68239 RepID=UPI0033CA6F3B
MRRGDATGLVREAWLIRVTGVVQGVGYRPFVYRLATSVRLSGWVLNDTLGVLIEACGPESALRDFVVALTERAPPLASVDTVRVRRRRRAEDAEADRGFEVRSSRHVPGASAVTTAPPDAHVCAQCLRETLDPADRRYRYPFTNCTDCGPRYSLIRSLPYDRSRTTMTAFTMCEPCATEYADPGDRRYHAQPNACPDCGPALSLHGPGGQLAEREAALAGAVEALAAGRVVAVKGLGGFHLAVNARDGEAVARLRRRKGRAAKPFAILVRDLTAASEVASYGPDEATLLTSPARPVVLLRKRPGARWVKAVALTVLSGVPVAATGGSDGTVRLWDLTTASPLGAPLAPHKGAVTSLALESDEQGLGRLASGGEDHAVALWAVALDGSCTSVPHALEHRGPVSDVLLLRTGTGLLGASADARGIVKLWDAATGLPWEGAGPEPYPAAINSLAAGRLYGRRVLISAARDSLLRIWDLDACHPAAVLHLPGPASRICPLEGEGLAVALGRDVVALRQPPGA